MTSPTGRCRARLPRAAADRRAGQGAGQPRPHPRARGRRAGARDPQGSRLALPLRWALRRRGAVCSSDYNPWPCPIQRPRKRF
eukprot:6671030-Prymnesium_polylepis.1